MKKIYIIVFVSTILIWGFYCICFGVGMAGDSREYSQWADVLISKNFNVSTYLHSVEYSIPPCLYLGFVGLVAFAKYISGVFWQKAIVVINILSGALLAVILANLVHVFTKNKVAACFIAFFYILSPEIMLWSRFVLSDISYILINFFLFYLIVKFLLSNNKVVIYYGGLIVLTLVLNCFYRPPALVMIPVIFIAFYLKMVKKEIRWRFFFFFFAVFASVLILFHSVVIKDTTFWPFEFGKEYWNNRVVVDYQNGIVINNRSNTYHQAPAMLGDYISITLDKFAHFFYFSDKTFKFYHKIINYLFFPLLYALFILGIIGASKKALSPNMRSLISLAIIVIIGFSLFHAMTTMDHDWRNRLPIFPYIFFVAGIGVDFLLRLLSRR